MIGEGLPNHRTLYEVSSSRLQLAEGQDALEVRLKAPAVDGVQVDKVYRFRRGSYQIDVSFEIANQGSGALQPYAYFQMVRDGKPPVGDSAMLPTYTGVAIYTEKEKFQKVDGVEAKFPHPYFGDLSAQEWLVLSGAHEIRHLKQIRRVIEAIG